MNILSNLPPVRGTLKTMSLAKLTWFRVGGDCVVFSPADENDLIDFLKTTPSNIPVMPLGLGSNTLFRDGGFNGVVVRMNSFSNIDITETTLTVGAGIMDAKVAKKACENSIDGLAFLSGIPGTIGGALAMNAGAYGTEIKDIFTCATAITRNGEKETYSLSDMNFSYRHCAIKGVFFVSATLQGRGGEKNIIQKQMDDISIARSNSQPIKHRTGGSTFRNPDQHKAWELIDKAGLRGHTIGGAMISDQHCNFLINTGDATAKDLEDLGNFAQSSVKEKFGVDLTWEIKRIGEVV